MLDTVSIVVRFALYADLTMLFGVPMFGLYALRGGERASGAVLWFRSLIATLAALGIGCSVLGLWALGASMSGVSLSEVDRSTIDVLVTETTMGSAWQARIGALLLVLFFSAAGWGRPTRALAIVALLAGIALGTLAWTGHGAMDEGARGWVHLIADIIHLLSAGVWLGALMSIALLIVRPATRMTAEHILLSHRALDEFAVTGTVVVGLIVFTGLVNSWILVGFANVGALFTTLYGQLLLAKLALFGGMLGLAAANRFRLTPALAASMPSGDHRQAVAALRRSLMSETLCAVVILALVAWLGTLAPPASGM